MKFSAVIALFVAVATAAPLLGDAADGVVGPATGVLSDPANAVPEVEDTASGLVGDVEKTTGNLVGSTESMANGLVGSPDLVLGGLLKPVTDTLKPLTDALTRVLGTVGGLAGGVLKN